MDTTNPNNRPTENEKAEGMEAESKRSASKRIVALCGVALLVLLYIATLLAAIFDTSASADLFRMSLFASFAIPLLVWIYTWMYGKLTGRKTIADSETADAFKSSEAAGVPEAFKTADTSESSKKNSGE